MTSASGRQTKSLLGGPQLASLSVTGTKVLATNGLDTEEWTPRYGGPRQYTHTKQPFPEQVAMPDVEWKTRVLIAFPRILGASFLAERDLYILLPSLLADTGSSLKN